MVPDFYAGFWSCGTGTITGWLLDFSSGIRIKTEADFTSKQGVFCWSFSRSSCKPVRESISSINLDHRTKAFGVLQLS